MSGVIHATWRMMIQRSRFCDWLDTKLIGRCGVWRRWRLHHDALWMRSQMDRLH